MKHIIVYTSDIHGNEVQYQKLVNYAQQISADSMIIGGDIAPKGLSGHEYIGVQRDFLANKLPQLIFPLKNSSTKVYVMMGNDDCAVNNDILERGEENGLYTILHGKRARLNADFDIVGYSYVPITPFGIKDWEKFDLSLVPEQVYSEYGHRKRTNYQLNGYKSSKEGWAPFEFLPEMEKKDSIQNDLCTELFQQDHHKTVYVMHSPPHDTNLDIIMDGSHVGSFAERLFIEQCQPYLTLHGHIHETVRKSGSFKQVIGNTLSLASGNHNVGKDLAVLVFNLYDLGNVKRLIL